MEKYRTWSDCNGDVESSYTKDELLTTVTIYWVTQTIGSSVRMYKENQSSVWEMAQDEKVPTPAGMAMFPQEIAKPPREWAERSWDVRRWVQMPQGGHFAALGGAGAAGPRGAVSSSSRSAGEQKPDGSVKS